MCFIRFELVLDEVKVSGCLDTETNGFGWFDAKGFGCHPTFDKTNKVGDCATNIEEFNYLFKWCMIEDFLSKVDIIPYLLKHQDTSDDVKITFGTDDESIRLELWIKGDCE